VGDPLCGYMQMNCRYEELQSSDEANSTWLKRIDCFAKSARKDGSDQKKDQTIWVLAGDRGSGRPEKMMPIFKLKD
jgi:hypothetical protein